jgi:hypothetical protein
MICSSHDSLLLSFCYFVFLLPAMCIFLSILLVLYAVEANVTCNIKLNGLSPRANYTDRATAACRRSDCQLVRIEGATWSAWRIPTAVFLGFLDRSRYFSIK